MDEISEDPTSPEFAARRAEARKALDAIDPAKNSEMLVGAPDDPLRRAWFEAVYARAQNDPALVPWANLAPHPLTKAWVGAQARGISGLRALDVGCGLGDNAECLAAAGASVTAFDLVELGGRMGEAAVPAHERRLSRGRSLRAARSLARRIRSRS